MLRPFTVLASMLLSSLTAVTVEAQSNVAVETVWSVSGTPVGTERALNPYVTLTERALFVGGAIQTGDNRRQVIQVFDVATGQHRRTIEDISGEVFAGHGEQIAANDRFIVTSTYRPSVAGSGSLQVYDAQTGAHLRTITNPRAKDSMRFGQLQISIEGTKILAGVGQSEDNLSTSWVFDAETGKVIMTIEEPDNKAGFFSKAPRTLFGFANALTDTHILISANQKQFGEMQGVGAAFLFDAETGELLQTFRPEIPEEQMTFGNHVEMNDNLVLISALRETGPLDWPSIEINAYDLQTGTLLYTLVDPFVPQTNEEVLAGNHGSGFGRDFTLGNDMLIISAPEASGTNKDTGALLFYDAATGESLRGIFNESGIEGENFGETIAIQGDLITVVSTPEVAPFREITRIDAFRLELN